MPYHIDIRPKDGYLLFTVSGTLESEEDALHYLDTVVTFALKEGQYRVLVDERKSSKKMDQHDCVLYADQWTSNNPPSGIRVAAVYSPSEAQKYHWVETILQNRSIMCRVFTDMNEARDWLLSRRS